MFAVLVIILFAAGMYVALCVDDRLPESWNYCKIHDVPIPGSPTTNGYLLGIIVASILLLIHSAIG